MYSPAPRIHSVILSSLILRSSDRRGLVLWCVAGICAGIGLFFNGFRLLQRRRLILDTPFSKIRSASIGMVEVSGLAVGPYALVAPITARSCYYYRTLVWEWKQQGKNKNWVKVAGECMHVPFFIDDNTGRVLVDPRGADLDLHRDFEQEFCDSFFTAKDPAPENVRSFLARHGVVINNKIKVQEFCVKPKNSLFILGTLSENPGLERRSAARAGRGSHRFSLQPRRGAADSSVACRIRAVENLRDDAAAESGGRFAQGRHLQSGCMGRGGCPCGNRHQRCSGLIRPNN